MEKTNEIEEFKEFIKERLSDIIKYYDIEVIDLYNYVLNFQGTKTYFKIENDELYGSINGKNYMTLNGHDFIKKYKLWKRKMKLKNLQNL